MPPAADASASANARLDATLTARIEEKMAELKQSLEASIAQEGRRLAGLIAENNQKAETTAVVLSQLDAEHKQLEAKVEDIERIPRSTNRQLAELSARFDESEQRRTSMSDQAIVEKLELATSKAVEAAEQQARNVVQAHMEQFQELRSQVRELMNSSGTNVPSAQGPAGPHVSNVESAVAPNLPETDDLHGSSVSSLAQSKDTSEKALMDLAAAFERQLVQVQQDISTTIRGEVQQEFAIQREVTDELFKEVDEELRDQRFYVDNMYTRSVIWRIRSFQKKWYDVIKGVATSVRSPRFTICAQPDMHLELIPGGQQSVETAVPLPGAAPLLPGACSLNLWFQPGYRLIFRLSAGADASASSRRYEHSFKSGEGELEDESGRVCFTARNFCLLDQAFDRRSNTTTFSLEFIEFSFIPPPPKPEPTVEVDVEAVEVEETEEAATQLDPTSVAICAQELGQTFPPLPPSIQEAKPDELSFTRSATSEGKIIEMVKNSTQALRNRSVRRAEWRLEGCSRLLEMCHAGESVESPPFSLAGIERLQLHFYPRGADVGRAPAGGVAQPCSLYVSGPVRSTLRGSLHVGSFSRTFEHTFARSGDSGGRGHLCALDHQVDCQDGVLLAVDITEVEAELPESSASIVLRHGVQKGAQDLQHRPPTPLGTKGTLRMKKGDPSKVQEAVRCVSLPSLNTRNLYLPHVRQEQRSR